MIVNNQDPLEDRDLTMAKTVLDTLASVSLDEKINALRELNQATSAKGTLEFI